MIKKTSRILTLAAATLTLLAACVEDDNLQQEQAPIRLTSDIAATRAIASPTQDTQLESGENIYVWANTEATSGTADWTQNAYIQAWELTAGASGALSSSNAYYYPPTSLSMVAIHGNFSTSFVEGLSPLPDFVTHTVKTDQSTLANYVVSDLLYWKQNGVTGNNNPVTIAFNHKLSKIEIHLVAGDYTENELDKMTVTLCNVLPTVSMDATDGTVGQAYGSAVSITPLKKGKVDYEAIIPPQQKPLDFIEVRYNGTVVKVDAQVNGFDSDQRYKYDFGLCNKDIRKNPLWYVAEYNVNYDGASTYSWVTTPDEGYFFNWSDAVVAAGKFEGWHLPTKAEWCSIIPGGTAASSEDAPSCTIWNYDSGTGSGTFKGSNQTVQFGYNDVTLAGMEEASYWKKVSSTEIHALRYLDTDFCSAWKYVLADNMLTVYATLIKNVDDTSADASEWYTNNWNSVYFGNNETIGAVQRSFYLCGYRNTGSGNSSTSVLNHNADARYHSISTEGSDWCYCLWFDTSDTYIKKVDKSTGRNIRLFKDGADPGISFANVTTLNTQKGYVVATNGKIYQSKQIAEQYAGVGSVIAMVFQVGNTGSTDYPHGIAVSIRDLNSSTGYYWCTTSPTTCPGVSIQSSTSDSMNDMDGVSNTTNLINDGHSHPAASIISTMSPAAPSGSAWCLPSSGQWIALFNAYGANITSATATTGWVQTSDVITCRANLTSALTDSTVGGTDFRDGSNSGEYWSSSKGSSTSNCFHVCFYTGYGISLNRNIGQTRSDGHIRPFLAF